MRIGVNTRRLKIYLAGPDVFLPDAMEMGKRKKSLCKLYGFEGLFPFDNEVSPDGQDDRIDLLIYRANVEMIRSADFGIFNLTPFRGPSADVGTVFELGMMGGLGKPVFGYTSDSATFLSRVRKSRRLSQDPSGYWRDPLGMSVENFDNSDNLMIEAIFVEQRHPIVQHRAVRSTRFSDLAGFEGCLRQAASKFSSNVFVMQQLTKRQRSMAGNRPAKNN